MYHTPGFVVACVLIAGCHQAGGSGVSPYETLPVELYSELEGHPVVPQPEVTQQPEEVLEEPPLPQEASLEAVVEEGPGEVAKTRIEGVIYDPDGEPAIMANVVYEEGLMGAATDYEGHFVLVGLPVGHHSLVATHPSGRAVVDVEVPGEGTATFDIHLHVGSVGAVAARR